MKAFGVKRNRIFFTATIISCNSFPFITRNILHIYPYFDRIIVVDGPSAPGPGQAGGDGRRLTDGKPYSTDGTLEALKNIKDFVDKENKVKIIQSSFPWPGKTAKFNAALKQTLEGYIWQFDCDEFYHPKDIVSIQDMLRKDSRISRVEFYAYHFWPDFQHHCKICPDVWGNQTPWRRIFRYKKGFRWIRHEPPVMAQGMTQKVIDRDMTNPIYMYHYGYCRQDQFRKREIFYGLKKGTLTREREQWEHGKPLKSSAGELEVFTGKHPIEVESLNE